MGGGDVITISVACVGVVVTSLSGESRELGMCVSWGVSVYFFH